MSGSTSAWERAAACLPVRIRSAVLRCGGNGEGVEEIRIRSGGLCTLTSDGRSVSCGVTASAEEVAQVVEALCGGSVYAHADEIREGVIAGENGIRAGIAGTASTDGGGIRSVRALTSVCLRLPHRRPGAADSILPFARRGESVLVWSPPGRGKTTILREAAAELGKPPDLCRVAVIDTRYELGAGAVGGGSGTVDFYRGWPRAAGMEAAVRTMSPQILICDELSGGEDCAAMERVRASGVTALCSIHAGSVSDALRHPLVSRGLFSVLCGVLPGSGGARGETAGAKETEEADGADRWPVVSLTSCGKRLIEVRRFA